MRERTCSVSDCEGTGQLRRDMCEMHYRRWRKKVTDLPPIEQPLPPSCSVVGCERTAKAGGWCPMHYKRWKRNGTTDDPTPAPARCPVNGCQEPPIPDSAKCDLHARRELLRRDSEARYWAHVDKNGPIPERRPDLGQCWIWTGPRTQDYGRTFLDGRLQGVHRWAYERFVDVIPQGFEIDHLCRTPPCVNPSHLEAVTKAENGRRGESPYAKNARKTHCVHGHPFDEANTEINRAGHRRCRTCARRRGLAWWKNRGRRADNNGDIAPSR